MRFRGQRGRGRRFLGLSFAAAPLRSTGSLRGGPAPGRTAAAGALALPPGVVGWLTILPEMMGVWKIQRQLVADIAAIYGKHATLTPEQETLLITLYAGPEGQVVGQIPYTLEPDQFVQFDPFTAVGLGSDYSAYGSIEVEVQEGGPVAAYASVVDNGTQDPILIPTLQAY